MLKFANGENYYVIDSDSDNSIADAPLPFKPPESNVAGDYANTHLSPMPLMPIVTLDSPNPATAATHEDGDQEQQMDALFRDVTAVQETLLATYPGMNVDPNVIFEQLEVCRAEENRKDKVVKFLGALEQTYRAQTVDFRMNAEGHNVGVGGAGGATATEGAAGAGTDGLGAGLLQEQDQVAQVEDVIDAVAAGRLGTEGTPVIDEGLWEWRNGSGADHRPPPEPPEDVYEGLMRDVQSIVDMFPSVDATEAYAHLEARRHEGNRVQNVVDELLHGIPREVTSPGPDANGHGGGNNHFGMHWPPYGPPTEQQQRHQHVDATLITNNNRKRVVDGGEVDDLLQLPSPNKILRLGNATTSAAEGIPQVVIINGETPPPVPVPELAVAGPAFPATEVMMEGGRSKVTAEGGVNAEAGGSGTGVALTRWEEEQLESLLDTFPDADPEYLEAVVRRCHGQELALQEEVTGMVEYHRYPKLKEREERLERERKSAFVTEMSIRQFGISDVMQWFEDPLQFFYDETKPVTPSYRSLAKIHMMNQFLKLTGPEVERILQRVKYHYAPAVKAAKEFIESKQKVMNRRRGRVRIEIFKGEPEELFFKELAFTRVEQEIRDNIAAKAQERERRIELAREEGTLITCLCCFDEEGLLDEMVDCEAGHMFCKTCVARGVDVAFGQGKTRFDCMAENCKGSFSLHMLKTALPVKVFSNWLRKIQEAEINEAGIPNLVQCPFCSFAAIVENPNDKLFRCLDPECLKESCRLCREVSHIPLRCEEVEKEQEVKLRTLIENELTEAVIRKCESCGRCFVKLEGCNKMTCPCGKSMCYVCKKPITDYTHFKPHGPCPQMNDTVQMHEQELATAAKKAHDTVIEKYPELRGVEMKSNVTKDVPAPTLPDPFEMMTRGHYEIPAGFFNFEVAAAAAARRALAAAQVAVRRAPIPPPAFRINPPAQILGVTDAGRAPHYVPTALNGAIAPVIPAAPAPAPAVGPNGAAVGNAHYLPPWYQPNTYTDFFDLHQLF